MDFVANFMEITTIEKNFKNRSTFVKLMNECIVAQFLLRHGVGDTNVSAATAISHYLS